MKAMKMTDLTALHDKLCTKLVNAPRSELDVVSNVDVQMHHVVAQAESMDYVFDLKTMWLTPSRWTMMINQYVDSIFLQEWIDKCARHIGIKGRGNGHMRFKEVKPRGGIGQGNQETRRWGSCMLGLSYSALPQPTITFFSRTSYLGYLAGMDLSVAYTCARYLANAMGRDVEEFRFVWMLQSAQFHNFKSLAFLLCHPNPETAAHYYRLVVPTEEELTPEARLIIAGAPAIRLSRAWLQKLLEKDRRGESYGEERYNTYRRIRRRLHTEVLGHDYAEQFAGWSYYREGDKEVKAGRAQAGDQKEYFAPYQQLPHTYVHQLNFDKLGVDMVDEPIAPVVMDDVEDDEE